MENIKLSTLPKETVVYVEGNINVVSLADILEDIKSYREKELYTTTPHHACFDAESIMDSVIEDEYCNGMYEDWDDKIKEDITDEDIAELQVIFDRILARNPQQNISYEQHKLIEIDI